MNAWCTAASTSVGLALINIVATISKNRSAGGSKALGFIGNAASTIANLRCAIQGGYLEMGDPRASIYDNPT